MNIENSAADALFCETFVTAPTETVGVFFVLQRNLDFTAAVKSSSLHQTDLTMYVVKPCFSNFTTPFSTSLLVFGFGTSLCYLVTCVQLLVHQFSAVFRCFLMSRSTIPGLQTCAASLETEEENRCNAGFSSARRAWLVVQPPRTVCFPWAQFFVKFDTISCARSCSAQSTATDCTAPTRRATTPLSRPEHAVGNNGNPEPTSDRFAAGYSGFCLTAASAVDCVNDWLNQVSVFIHARPTVSSVLPAAKEPRLQVCCGGVVREPPVSVRVKAGR